MTAHPHLLLHQMEVGPMHNYIYFIGDSQSREVMVVDPAWDVDFLREEAAQNDLTIKGMLITHGHPDHTNGIHELLRTHDIPVYVSEDEASFYKPIHENVMDVAGGDTLEIGKTQVRILHTPGHTPGSQCFMVDSHLVAGDTLFLDGCGRCDLPGGDMETMYDTLYNRLLKLPAETIIYPGHNYHPLPCDSLEHQKKSNPFLKCQNLKQFLNLRV